MDFEIDGRVQKLDGWLSVLGGLESEEAGRSLGKMKILPRGEWLI